MATSTMAVKEIEVSWEQVKQALAAGDKVVLDRSGEPALVLLPLETWNALVDKIEELEDAVDSDRIMAAIESGAESTIPWETIRERLVSEEALDE